MADAGYSKLNVEAKDALLHHYRHKVGNDINIGPTSNLVDKSAHAWAEQLMRGVQYTCKRAFGNPDGSCGTTL